MDDDVWGSLSCFGKNEDVWYVEGGVNWTDVCPGVDGDDVSDFILNNKT